MSTETEFDLILAALRAITPTKGVVIDDRTMSNVTLSNVGRFNCADGVRCVNIVYGKTFALHRVFVDSFGNLHLSKHAIPNTSLVIASETPADIESVNEISSITGRINTNLSNYAAYDKCAPCGYIDYVTGI